MVLGMDTELYERVLDAIMSEQDSQLEELDLRRALAEELATKTDLQRRRLQEAYNPCAEVPLAEASEYDIVTEWPDYSGIPTDSTTTSPKCECGAKHTSFPDSHLSFCPMKEI